MRIGILGSGLMGGKLGTIFARAGHQVVFSYARSERKLKRLDRDAGERASAGLPGEAAADADALLLAVHWSRVKDVLKQAGNLSGKVLISCSLPMNATDTALAIARTSSGAEALAKKVRKGNVVSAFGTVPSEVLFDVFEAKRRSRRRPSLLYCGNDDQAKQTAARLIRDVGFGPVDAGPLKIARYLEPFTLAIAQLAYESEMVQIRNVPEALHRTLKVRAADAGRTLSDYLLAELERLAARPTRHEMLTRIHGRKRVTLKTPAATVIREERESA